MKKKNRIFIYLSFAMGLLIMLSYSCNKDEDNVPDPPPTMTDVEGNVYNIVTIGTQTWMAENLKVTKYNNDTVIPLVTGTTWEILTTPAYCWYDNDEDTYKDTYGALYNWYTVNTGMLCPTGWHVPTDVEWTELIDFLGGENVAGGKLKEIGTDHWVSPNIGATDENGFTALPGGYRNFDGVFYNIGENGNWWSSTEDGTGGAWYRKIQNSITDVSRLSYMKQRGFSIRCVKD
ncbi:MAG: fibrobacter succinogenes major paralogous domain-containing protein [Bacteroidales bacterium]|nr:fibrobacter succinogenes major paralogous domain-containing protein [Bacteroidales bacterium]